LLPITYSILKGGDSMDRTILLFLASIIAGFALIRVPLAGTPFAGIEPITTFIGVLTVLVFSLVLIFRGILGLIDR